MPNKKVEVKSFEVKFNKRNVKPQQVINADSQLREIAEELNPIKENSKGDSFVEQMDNLIESLSKHDDGYFDIHELPSVRKSYIKSRAIKEGARPQNLTHYSNVFSAVVSNALYQKAKEITKAEAKEFDAELEDLQENSGLFFRPQRKEGDVYLPCKMEDIAFIDDELANTWDLGEEPYANIF